MTSSSRPGDACASPRHLARLLSDLMNTMDFEGAQPLHASSMAAVDPILRLRDQADAMEAPLVYVNDHFGLWNAERSTIIDPCAEHDDPARERVRRLAPRPDTTS